MPSRPFSIYEMYFTIQGEGHRTGRQAVFCRFSGCNFWSGLEKDRASAQCTICDTLFVGTNGTGGGVYECPERLADAIYSLWPSGQQDPYVVFTGGEPLLQLNEELVAACHKRHFEVAIETNGSISVPPGVDWVCVSPKVTGLWVQKSGDELKLLYPFHISPTGLTDLNFEHFFIQPVDGADIKRNTELAIAYCRSNPTWRVSLQTHKLMGMP